MSPGSLGQWSPILKVQTDQKRVFPVSSQKVSKLFVILCNLGKLHDKASTIQLNSGYLVKWMLLIIFLPDEWGCTRDTFGVISLHFKQYLFWRGEQAKPIVYLKCVRSQTSLITFILPAERKSFHLQAGRFYFRKSTLLLWITPYLKKGNVPRESKGNMQGLCVWFRRPYRFS